MSKKLNLIPDPARSFRTPDGALVSYMEIDEETATLMLDANTKNRSVSNQLVDQYGRSLETDEWPFTGDGIRLGPNGLVLDGQHRLKAIEKTGVTMRCLVISDLDEVVQRYLDSGRKRTAADQLSLEGVANGTHTAAIARLLLSWTNWRAGRGAITPSNIEVNTYVLENIGLMQDAVHRANEVRTYIKKVSGSALGAAYARGIQVTQDPFLMANFFTKLANGAELSLDRPWNTLRNTLIRSDRANQIVNLYQVVRAWNAEMTNKPLGKMQLPKGGVSVLKFPDMLAPKVEEVPTTLDEEVAEALQKLGAAEKATHAA